MRKLRALAFLAALLPAAAFGQAGVQLGSGQVFGNSTASRTVGKAETVTAILDRALGLTRGAILERGASGWTIVAPSATVGLPWVGNGTGADPAYQVLGVAGGGTGLNTLVIGDLLYASSTSALARLADVATGNVLISGGVGAAPSYGKVTSSHLNITPTTCTNQFVTAVSATGTATCTTDTLAGAQHANQGTTTTVLHGNAAGNPSWGAVALGTDVSGTLPIGSGGTGQTSAANAITALLPSATTAGTHPYWNGTAWVNHVGNTSLTQCWAESSAGLPSWVPCVSGPASSTDKAAALFSGTGGQTLQNSPLLVDTTTGALSRSGGGGIAVQASNTAAAACSGCIGDYLDAPIGGGMTAGTVVPTSTTTTVNNIPNVPAGDWMIQCGVLVCPTAATLTGVTELHISLSDTSGALMSPAYGAPYAEHVALQDNQCQYRTTGMARWNNSSSRTTYCTARMTYTGGSATVQSWMWAYRFH